MSPRQPVRHPGDSLVLRTEPPDRAVRSNRGPHSLLVAPAGHGSQPFQQPAPRLRSRPDMAAANHVESSGTPRRFPRARPAPRAPHACTSRSRGARSRGWLVHGARAAACSATTTPRHRKNVVDVEPLSCFRARTATRCPAASALALLRPVSAAAGRLVPAGTRVTGDLASARWSVGSHEPGTAEAGISHEHSSLAD
jgi:hypothetical protein